MNKNKCYFVEACTSTKCITSSCTSIMYFYLVTVSNVNWELCETEMRLQTMRNEDGESVAQGECKVLTKLLNEKLN